MVDDSSKDRSLPQPAPPSPPSPPTASSSSSSSSPPSSPSPPPSVKIPTISSSSKTLRTDQQAPAVRTPKLEALPKPDVNIKSKELSKMASKTTNSSSSSKTINNTKSSNEDTQTSEENSRGYIINANLPRFRQSRKIDPKVIEGPPMPSLRDVPIELRDELFMKKVRWCCYTFPYTEENISPEINNKKNFKRFILLEIVSYIANTKPSFTDEQMTEQFEMIRCNLFRPQQQRKDNGIFDNVPQMDYSWKHLQVVYEQLLRITTGQDTNLSILEKHFNASFILDLLEQFDSEDPRERDYLKIVLHKIYGNFMNSRLFIRRSINNIFYTVIYETGHHNGIAEQLETLGSIINGFAQPLKEQHKQFLFKVQLPQHKIEQVASFHSQLSYCIIQFLEKDPTLCTKILSSLFRYWPKTCTKKELLFQMEIEEILSHVPPKYANDVIIDLFRILSKCISSPHFQVAEKALSIQNLGTIMRYISSYRLNVTPMLASALYSNTHMVAKDIEDIQYEGTKWVPGASTRPHGHWNITIVDITSDVLKFFTEFDNSLMADCKVDFDSKILNNLLLEKKKKETWDSIEKDVLQKFASDVREMVLFERDECDKVLKSMQKTLNYTFEL